MTTIRFKLPVAGVALLTGLCLGLPPVLAEVTRPVTIKSPDDLKTPDGGDPALKIASKRLETGLIEFVVRMDPEAVEHVGETGIYKGRVTASGNLDLSADGRPLASIPLSAEKGPRETVFRFSLAETLAKTAKVTLSTRLHEKNGMPTLGGGHTFMVSLQGFSP